MKNALKGESQMPFYCLLVLFATLLIASLFSGCSLYQHEELEIIRCPVIDADTIRVPDWNTED